MAEVMGLQYSKCGSMIYATDHYGVLSAHMERLLHDILKSDDQIVNCPRAKKFRVEDRKWIKKFKVNTGNL